MLTGHPKVMGQSSSKDLLDQCVQVFIDLLFDEESSDVLIDDAIDDTHLQRLVHSFSLFLEDEDDNETRQFDQVDSLLRMERQEPKGGTNEYLFFRFLFGLMDESLLPLYEREVARSSGFIGFDFLVTKGYIERTHWTDINSTSRKCLASRYRQVLNLVLNTQFDRFVLDEVRELRALADRVLLDRITDLSRYPVSNPRRQSHVEVADYWGRISNAINENIYSRTLNCN